MAQHCNSGSATARSKGLQFSVVVHRCVLTNTGLMLLNNSAVNVSRVHQAKVSCHHSIPNLRPHKLARHSTSLLVTTAAAGLLSDGSSDDVIALLPDRTSATIGLGDEAGSSGLADTDSATTFSFACPICHETNFKLQQMPTTTYTMCCARCSRTYRSDARYVDLTLTSGLSSKPQQKSWGGTELFRSPLVSFAYERGWRQNFAWYGFPGVDKEFDMAMEYLRPVQGKVLLDMSCGSGLFTRKFAASGLFSGVIAADFSESMLQQTQQYLKQEKTSSISQTPVMLLRADVGRLPFATGSVHAIHAGAALHCWPDPQTAMAEISRVLAPGGVFVASTFLKAAAPLGDIFGDEAVRPLNVFDINTRSTFRQWEERELRDLATTVGLQDFQRIRNWRFIMLAATKPLVPEEPKGELLD